VIIQNILQNGMHKASGHIPNKVNKTSVVRLIVLFRIIIFNLFLFVYEGEYIKMYEHKKYF